MAGGGLELSNSLTSSRAPFELERGQDSGLGLGLGQTLDQAPSPSLVPDLPLPGRHYVTNHRSTQAQHKEMTKIQGSRVTR
jgi:hypothetical protein